MRTFYKIAAFTSVLTSLSFGLPIAEAQASVPHRRVHTSSSHGFLTIGTASDPDIASMSIRPASPDATRRRGSSRVATSPASGAVTSRRSQIGTASFYHSSLAGLRTASGERYREYALTAAHRTLDLGTRVRVTNLANSRSVVVTVNDRGPYVSGRIIDLSRRAALMLGFVNKGITRVRIEPLGKNAGHTT